MPRLCRRGLCLFSVLSIGCQRDAVEAAKPPPLPEAPAVATQAPPAPEHAPTEDEAAAVAAPSETEARPLKKPNPEAKPRSPRPAQPAPREKRANTQPKRESPQNTSAARGDGASLYELARRGEAKLPQRPAPKPVAPKPAPVAPKPAPAPQVTPKPARPAAPKPRTRVSVPSTARVNVQVPAGLQRALDADPRMQPWVNKVIAVADSCQRQNPKAVGTIKVRVRMHENERPDADILSLPSQLSPIVACATGKLMRTKMPLFTAREGERYTVLLNFSH